jgi:hypothetical protein
VNILSHLEKTRVEYLVSQGMDFSEAKTQAQSEVLGIFNMDAAPSESSELLDISMEGNGHAQLLAASVILKGYRSEAEMTELLSEIGTDLREDGTLDNAELGSQWVNHAVFLNKGNGISSANENKNHHLFSLTGTFVV